jgi:type II secretory pathway pseudopilin PulG
MSARPSLHETVLSAEPRPRSARAGLTLLEIVIAMGLLAVVLLGVFSQMASSMRLDAVARERDAVTRAAFQELEDRVMAISDGADNGPYDQLIAASPISFDVSIQRDGTTYLLEPATTSPNPNGRVGLLTITVDPAGTYDGGKAHLIRAEAKVRWRSASAGTSTEDQDQEIVITSMKVRP